MKSKIFLAIIICFLFISSASAEEKFFEIKAVKFSYTPNIIKVDSGDTVKIRLISEDVHHGFYLDGYNIGTTARPGQEGSLKFVASKTGRFSFRCSVTCGEFHPYMVGSLIVEPNSRFFAYVVLIVVLGVAHSGFIVLCNGKIVSDNIIYLFPLPY